MLTDREWDRRWRQHVREYTQERNLAKFTNPDEDVDLSRVWVIFQWQPNGTPDSGEWILSGFRRKRNRRKPQSMNRFFASVRRKLMIHKKTPVQIMDLRLAREFLEDDYLHTRPPQFQQRKVTMVQRTPQIVKTKWKTKTKTRAYLLSKTAKYIAIGRNSWDRAPGYMYCGPLDSTTRYLAQLEAKRMFGLYQDLLVIATSDLSKPLFRAMIRSRRVRAGITRIAWPEVPPTFDAVWSKFIRRLIRKEFTPDLPSDDPQLALIYDALHHIWKSQGQPWLSLSWFRKQIKPWRAGCGDTRKKRKPKRTIVVARKGATARKGNSGRKRMAARKRKPEYKKRRR